MADENDDTPRVFRPCPECGSPLVMVKDTEPTPHNADQAWKMSLVCAASRGGTWVWCPRRGILLARTDPGAEWVRLNFERRTRPR